MRRFWMTVCSLLFSILALAGGSNSAILCLHEAGVFHVTGIPNTDHDHSTNGRNDACDTTSIAPCDWCLDVEVRGLELAEVRFNDGGEVFIPAPAFLGNIPVQEWGFPTALCSSLPLARAPPAQPQALIVAQKTVLLI